MKFLAVILAFLALFFFGNRSESITLPREETTETTAPFTEPVPTEAPQPTEPPLEAQPTAPGDETEPPLESQPTANHSALYLEGVSQEDMVNYFNEVCLDAEYVNAGNPSVLQRWEEPIAYSIIGNPTPEDIAVLEEFCQWLNTLEGFPGIGASGNDETANMRIHFVSEEEFMALMGSNFANSDGGVTFWYENDMIYDAQIGIRTDLDQHLRNSVILEEIYNSLGPAQDTDLRPDSIIYAAFSEPQTLSAVDRVILQLLYHPAMRCGMNADACREVISALYY